MNKSLIIAVTLVLSSLNSAFPQGTLLFSNRGGPEVIRGFGGEPVPRSWGKIDWGGVQLAYALAGTPSTGFLFFSTAEDWLAVNHGWALSLATPFVEPGIYDAGALTLFGITPGQQIDVWIMGWAPVIPGFTEGATNYFEAELMGQALRGWDGPYRIEAGGPETPTALAPIIGQLILIPTVPEPSTGALVLLGLGVMMQRRIGASRGAKT